MNYLFSLNIINTVFTQNEPRIRWSWCSPKASWFYHVKYRYNNEEHVAAAALLLKIGKHNKNLIKKIISKLVDISYRSISHIKFKFRKQVLNYNPGDEGTRKYFDDIRLQRDHNLFIFDSKEIKTEI